MASSTIAEIEHLHNVHSGSPQTTKCNPPQITKFYSMIFKQQLTDISTVLNNTGNTTKLLISFNDLDIAQQKVLLSSSLLSEKQKEQCITMATLSATNTKYTAEQLAKATGISTETLANWGLIESTDSLTISELAEKAASDAQAKTVLDKIIAQNAEAVANGEIATSNVALATSEGGATLATGAFTTAIKANISAMWTWMTTTPIGWLTLLVTGVFAAVKAYDALTVSVKEQKEKMEDSLSAYNNAKSELSNITTELENQEQAMNDLLAKEKLTYAEQGQLEELQSITKELRIQKDLAKKEEGRTQKEVAKDASDLFNKQFGKYDISENAINEYQNNANITGNNVILVSDEDNISSMIAGCRQFNNLLDKAYGSENQEDIDYFKSLTEDLKDSIFETAQDLQEQQLNIANYYNAIKDTPYDDLTTEQKEIIKSYNSISNAIELIYKQLDPNTWKSMQIENVFNTDGVEKTKEELVEMVKAGEFDESTLQSYPKLSETLEQNKISASELRNELEALAETENKVKSDTFNDKNHILSTTDILSQVELLSKGLDQLDKIYANVYDKGDFDWSSILNNEDFENTFGNLGSAYEEFIKTVSNSPNDINACQSAFNNLTTTYLNNCEGMKNVTAETRDATIAFLEQKGIVNADEFVDAAIRYNETSKALKNLTAETRNETIALLERNGVANATELVDREIAYQKEKLKFSTEEFADSAEDEIMAMYNSVTATEAEKQALAQLWLEKLNFNNCKISTSDDINQIIAMANAAGASAEYITKLKSALEQFQSMEAYANKYKGTENFGPSELARYKQAEKKANNLLADLPNNIPKLNPADFYSNITANYGGNSTSKDAADKAAKDAEKTKETFNWIETALSRIQRTITNLGKTVSATWRSWTDRNKALKDQVSAVTQEINLQEQAYNRYMALANGVGLPEPYRSLVENGAIDISTITDENLAEQIKAFQDYYEKALACKDAVSDLNDELANLVQTEFDHTAKKYDDELSMHEHQSKMLQSSADILETKGYMVGSGIYDALARQEEEKITTLQNKYASLESVLNSSNIPKYSEQWYAMQLEIAGVAEELQNSQKNLAEYNNTLREIDWELFDKLQDKISGVTTESDFLIELMSNKKMYNDDASITEHGQATLGLHAVNYNTYMAQADEYATELEQINADLANDPYNQTLLDRRDELLEQQRDMILAAEKEKQSMKDLKSEGYDALLDSMSSIIDKRKEMFSQIKDLHDYEKSIADQTAEVSKYQKLIDSMQGMADTEEGRATLQKYEVSLKEAKENLEETEYERYIKDQEQLLDSLYDQTEEWVNSRLDDLDGLIGGVIESTNANASEIQATLETEAESVGATLSTEMKGLWDTNGEFTSVVSSYGSQQLTTLQEILATMKEYFSDMKKDAEEKAKEEIAASSPAATPQPAPAATLQSSPANTSSGNSSWGSWFISKRDTYPKSKLNTETSVVDRLKYRDIDSSKDARERYYYAMGGSGVYVGSPQQNQWMLTQMKAHGFTDGGRIGPLIKSSGEDGFILAKTGEEILSLEKIRALGESFAMIDPVINSMPRLVNSMDMYNFQPEKTPHVDIGDIHFDLPNVHNADEFITELQHSNRFEKIIKEITYGGALGKNRYNKFKY